MQSFVTNLVTLLPTLAAFFVDPQYNPSESQEIQSQRISPDRNSCSGGSCIRDTHSCLDRGGKISGLCSDGIYCCKYEYTPISCGETSAGEQFLEFKSAKYPELLSGDLTCEAKIILKHDTRSIRVDFVEIQMDGQAYLGTSASPGQCESDIIFFKGFESWTPPPRCGNLTGYSFLIDTKSHQARGMEIFRIVNLMSSQAYRWNIRILLSSGNPTHTAKSDKGEVPLTTIEDDTITKILELVKNGNATSIQNVPWQVSIRKKGVEGIESELLEDELGLGFNCSAAEGNHFCGGSIIGDQFILTAAHCFEGTSKVAEITEISSLKVVVGDNNLCSDDFISPTDLNIQPVDYEIDSIILHYAYDSHLVLNDLAILKLKVPIQPQGYFFPIELAKTGEEFTGQDALVSGWGETINRTSGDSVSAGYNYDGSFFPFNLHSSNSLVVLKQELCILTHWGVLNETQQQIVMHPKYVSTFNSTICTHGVTEIPDGMNNGTRTVSVGVGKGDSGGPLVVYRNESDSTSTESMKSDNNKTVPVLAGIVSVGREIFGLYFSFYTSVAFYREWIDLVMNSFN